MTSIDKSAAIEAKVQVAIMLIMGVTAACASFTHIHDVTVKNGQESWIGWANAVVVELMSIVAGLELRRRKRKRQSVGFVYTVLYAATLVSLAAQVAEADPSVWGWIVAALPALGFLAVVKIVLSRSQVEAGPDQGDATPSAEPVPGTEQRTDSAVRSAPGGPNTTTRTGPNTGLRTGPTEPANADPAAVADRTVVPPHTAATDSRSSGATAEPPVENSGLRGTPSHRSMQDRSAAEQPDPTTASAASHRPHTRRAGPHKQGEHSPDLLKIARIAAVDLQNSQGKVTRNGLAREIRRRGCSIGTDRASDLWRQVQNDKQTAQ